MSSLVGLAIVAAGCGSGSGSPSPSPSSSATPTPTPSATATPPSSPVPVTTRIVWGPRSRQVGVQKNAVGGPSSALSATITLTQGTAAPALTLNVNRGVPSGPQDYPSAPQQITPGIYTLNATFYAQNNQQGPVVGTAQASTTVLPDGTLSTTIATVGKVQRVVINPSSGGGLQVVGLGQAADVSYTAYDASGNPLALTPGSAFVAVRPNTLPDGTLDPITRATASGETVTGVFPNRATLVVSVDGVTSAPTQIIVRSNVAIAVTPNNAVLVGLGQAQAFTATVANDGPAGFNGVYFQILNNGANDVAQLAGTLSTAGPATQTVFAATGALNGQTGVVNNNVPNAYVLRVTSVYDTDIFVDVPITVTSLVNVVVTPNPATLSINQTQKFNAVVNLLPAGASGLVTWTIQSGGGRITTDGTFTAPSTPQTVVIRATSRYDVTKFVDVPISVQSGSLPIVVN